MEIPKYVALYRKDLMLKNYAESSIENYVSQVYNFLSRYKKEFTEPAKINETTIKEWLLQAKTINSSINQIQL